MRNGDMLKKCSINLCDYSGTYVLAGGMIGLYRAICSQLDALYPQCKPDEVWLGSEFCENLFLCISAEEYQKKIAYFTTQGIRVHIAVPELHETNFKKVISILRQMKKVDGFVVNDIGTAVTIHQTFPQKKLILGRSFDKSVREIRCMPSEICNKFDRQTADFSKGLLDSAHLSFFRSLGAAGITTDSVPYIRQVFNKSELQVYFQYPRTLLSHAAICEFSQAEGNNPLRGCSYCCKYFSKEYNLSGKSVVKAGKIISHKEDRAISQCISGDVRLVYTL